MRRDIPKDFRDRVEAIFEILGGACEDGVEWFRGIKYTDEIYEDLPLREGYYEWGLRNLSEDDIKEFLTPPDSRILEVFEGSDKAMQLAILKNTYLVYNEEHLRLIITKLQTLYKVLQAARNLPTLSGARISRKIGELNG
jgi:hypothetical protein